MDLTPSQLADMLARDCERVCRELLPNGKRQGDEWCAGSVSGEAGNSLKVRLSGDRAGKWADFATSDDSGDLIDLWGAVRGLSVGETLREVRAWLGVPEPERFVGKREKSYDGPAVPKVSAPAGDTLEWLTNARKISPDAMKAYRIASGGRRVYFPFLDPEGNRVMLKWRSIDDKKTAPTSSNQRPVLFGWQAIPEKSRTAAITEGEIDAMSLWQYGYPALSVPFGGGGGEKQSWIEHEHENLARFDEIYLALDTDGPGQEATREIIRRLGAHRCRVVELPRKDANQCLVDGVQKSEIDHAFRKAVSFDPDGLKSAGAFLDDARRLMYPDPNAAHDGIYLPWEKAKGRIELRRAELVLVFGINSHGKTHLVDHIALHALKQGERAMVASLEYRPARWLKETIVQASGVTDPTPEYFDALGAWLSDRLWLWGHTGTAKTEKLLEVMDYCYRRYGVRVFVIDSLLKCGIDEDDYVGQKRFVEQLTDFKNATNTTVLLVCHARKQRDENAPVGKMDIRGAGAISDLADTVLSIHRNKRKERERSDAEAEKRDPDPEVIAQPDSWLTCDKQRDGGWEGRLGLWFHPSTQFLEFDHSRPIRYVNFTAAPTAREDFA